MARPVVGITTYITPASWGVWQLETALVPADYVHAVERAGGRPLLVPPSLEGITETLDALDGLMGRVADAAGIRPGMAVEH